MEPCKIVFFFFALCVCLPIYILSVFSYVSISHPVSGVEDKWQWQNRRQNDSPFAHAESNTNNKTWAKKKKKKNPGEKIWAEIICAHVHNRISLLAVASSLMLFVIREAEALGMPKYDHWRAHTHTCTRHTNTQASHNYFDIANGLMARRAEIWDEKWKKKFFDDDLAMNERHAMRRWRRHWWWRPSRRLRHDHKTLIADNMSFWAFCFRYRFSFVFFFLPLHVSFHFIVHTVSSYYVRVPKLNDVPGIVLWRFS